MCLISYMVNGIKMSRVHVVRVANDSTIYKVIHVRVNQLISCLWSLLNVVLISAKWSPSLWANLSGAHVTYQGPLVRECSACDIKILPSFFSCGNFVWLECCFILPMGRTKQNLGSHQGESADVCKYSMWLLKPGRTCPSNTLMLNIYQTFLQETNITGLTHWKCLPCSLVHVNETPEGWISARVGSKSVDAVCVLQASGSHCHFYC